MQPISKEEIESNINKIYYSIKSLIFLFPLNRKDVEYCKYYGILRETKVIIEYQEVYKLSTAVRFLKLGISFDVYL